jgi:hypothetical protein
MQEVTGRELRWSQPRAMKGDFELRDGSEVVATLSCRGSFNPTSTFASADGRWQYRQAGFWGLRTVVLDAESGAEVAMLRRSAWHASSRIEIKGTQVLQARSNFFMTRLEFLDMSDRPLMRCDHFRGMFRKSSDLRLAPEAANRSELPWLVGLIWHVALRMQQEASGAAGGAAAAAAG